MVIKKKRLWKQNDFVYYAILAIVSLILFMRNYYSFCWSDESYYLSSVYRIYQGDVINKEIWENIYFAYPLLIPFSIYIKFFGTEGIYLFFRHIQVFLFTIVGFKAFNSFKSYNKNLALLISLSLMIYSRANIMGTSYYNMTYCFYMLALLYLFDALYLNKNNSFFYGLLTGCFAGIGLLFNPYIFIPAIVLFLFSLKKNKRYSFSLFCGSSVIGIIFVVVLLKTRHGSGVVQIATSGYWDYFLQNNKLLYFFLNLYRFYDYRIWLLLFLFLFMSFCFRKQKCKKNNKLLIIISVVFFLFCIRKMVFIKGNRTTIGFLYIAFSIYVLSILPLLTFEINKYEKKTAIFFYTSGLLLSLAFQFASNTGIDAMGIGFVPIMISNIILISRMNIGNYWLNKSIVILLIAVVIVNTFLLRIYGVYRDGTIGQLNSLIEKRTSSWFVYYK